MTPLDSALRAAQQDPAGENEFYNLFLNTELLVPIHEAMGVGSKPQRATGREKFAPIILQAQGKKYLPVFDTEERLQAWAKRGIQYVGILAHALVESFDESVYWALNVGTEFYKEFGSDEIRWLKEQIRAARPHAQKIPQGTNVLVGTPAKVPPMLVERLRDLFGRNQEVKAAHLAQVMVEKPGEKPHLMLVIKIEPLTPEIFHSIAQEIGLVARATLGPSDAFDLAPFTGGEIDGRIVKTVPAFFTR